jgi:hypothetical protein
MSEKSDARKTLESAIISGLARRAYLTSITIDKADILVPDLIQEIFHDPSVKWAAKQYIAECEKKEAQRTPVRK